MSERIPLEGKTFGKLYVEKYICGGKYHCICECKNEVDVFGSNLKSKHTTSCGCIKEPYLITPGMIFGYLNVLNKSEGKFRGKQKRVCWKCQCLKCGNIVDIYADCIMSGQETCGCIHMSKDIPSELRKDFSNGTQLSKIKSNPTKSNKSGVVGVNWDKSRNKWQVSIRFIGRKYNLGRFSNFDIACNVRKEAESKIFGEFLEWYNDKNVDKVNR